MALSIVFGRRDIGGAELCPGPAGFGWIHVQNEFRSKDMTHEPDRRVELLWTPISYAE
jgi:hypothetical protein